MSTYGRAVVPICHATIFKNGFKRTVNFNPSLVCKAKSKIHKKGKLADMNTNQGKRSDLFGIRNHSSVRAEALRRGQGRHG